MFKLMRTYFKNTAGSILPITAIMLPLLLGVTGAGVDVSVWLKNKRDLQAAADAAAIAGAWELAYDFTEGRAEDAALKEAVFNGYSSLGNNDLNVVFGLDDDGNTMVTVTLTSGEDQYLSQFIYQGDIYSTVIAAAIIDIPDGDFCMLSLDPTADGAITAVGAVDIDSVGCGIAVNSNSDSALDLGGNVDVDIANLSVVGDIDVGPRVDLTSGSVDVNSSPAQDPYADLETPDFNYPADCDENNFSASGDVTLDPGLYCGGLRLSGNGDVTFNPGVYMIYGGDFTITGNGTVDATGVSFILTGSDADGYGNVEISGGKDMFFAAPLEGDLDVALEDFEGISFYQDRNAPDGPNCNSIVGNSAVDIIGAAYFPSRCLNIGGNANDTASSNNPCSRIIANRIVLHGTPNIGNECDGIDVEDIGQLTVRLIL